MPIVWEDEEKYIIDPIEKRGWEYLEEPPSWVIKASSKSLHKRLGTEFAYEHHRGNAYVYKITSTVHVSPSAHVFRKLKSDYYETTPEKGTCPNCQSYVRRYEDDDYLTCHRCGWQYKPITERIRNLF